MSDGRAEHDPHHPAFFDEADDELRRLEALLLRADAAAGLSRDDLDAIFRCAHSIKGAAAALGFDDIAALTHQMETLLDGWRRGGAAPTAEGVDLLLQGADAVRARIAALRNGTASDAMPDADALMQALQQHTATGTAVAPPPTTRKLTLRLGPLAQDDGADEVVQMFADMPELGRLDALADSFAQDRLKRFTLHTGCTDQELLALIGMHLPAAQISLRAGVAAPPALAPAATATATASLRVPAHKIDRLIDLAGQLLIAQSAVAQACAGLDRSSQARLADTLAALERPTRELQHAVMSMRMVPVSVVFARFPRLLRELCAQLGKQIELHTEGEATELDKGMVEGLGDPLLHLLRNACDHGIEPAHERLALGKAAAGRITLRAAHQADWMLIEICDDGRGLSRQALLARAREQGVRADEAMSDEQVWELAFLPGLSTARQLSSVSGRGVGMDVVRRNIETLGGTVQLRSQGGHGTVVSLRVPLTLAVIDVVGVSLGNRHCVLPLAAVVEAVPSRLAQLLSGVGGRPRLRVRDQTLPLIDTQAMFEQRTAAANERALYIVVEAQQQRAALRVDRLHGQHPAVVKRLSAPLRRSGQASAATILADGSVALILDTARLVREACHEAAAA